MRMKGGNRAIQEHVSGGRALHLFEAIPEKEMTRALNEESRAGFCRYFGEMQCVRVIKAVGPDILGNQTKIYKFQLVRVGGGSEAEAEGVLPAAEFSQGHGASPSQGTSLAELRKKAQEASRPP